MKKVLSILLIMAISVLLIVPQVNAADESIKISLSDNQITVDGEKISGDNTNSVYLSTQMDNGGTSSEAKEANEKIGSIVNITKAGTYEVSGELTDGQISINANKISGEVKIILNNANITCKNAPAIFVYSKDIENENCKVIIETAEDSENIITGGKLKTSVEGWEDQDKLDYYVEKGYSDEHEYYERYKYDGAISSDISLTFQGKGYLNIVSTKKEGIECKSDITINDGIYEIDSQDDGINACTDNKTITINEGTLFVNINPEADEGDGIDSNGSIVINGGSVYSFACPGSDNGLDADQGIYINGGRVLSTGSMQEEIKSSNNKTIIQMNFSTEVNAGDSVVIVDESGNEVVAFKLDRKITTFAYSSNNLENKEYSVYTGTNITGETDTYGFYTKIDNLNLDNLTKQENSGNGMMMGGHGGQFGNEMKQNEQNNSYFLVVLGVLAGVLVLVIVVAVISSKKKGKNK